MPRPKQRTRALRDQVLQVAVETLARDGVAGFTTRKVARGASTSTPAVYELFGDKAGLVRSVFFEGFRMLRHRLERRGETADVRADLLAVFDAYRTFIRANPVLSHVMFARPFADFDPGPAELEAGRAIRELIVWRVQRCIDARLIAHGADATDVAHVLLALSQGLAAAELASRLGRSRSSVDRRWALGLDAVLAGFAPPRPAARLRATAAKPPRRR